MGEVGIALREREPHIDQQCTDGEHDRGVAVGILHHVSAADCLTIANGICGVLVLAILLGYPWGFGGGHSRILTHTQLVTCAALIGAGSVFDLSDGAVARWHGSSGMGDALDMMSDVLTFGVAPAALLIAAQSSEPEPWRSLVVPVAVILVAAAMLRLARSASAASPSRGGFYGLAMPSAAGAVTGLVLLHLPPAIMLLGVLVVSWLMVSGIYYPHPDRRTIPLLCGAWIALGVALAGLIPVWPVVLAFLTAVAGVTLVEGVAGRQRRSAPHIARKRQSP